MDGHFHHNFVDTRIRLTNDDKTFEKIQTPFHNTNQAKEQGIANDSYEVHQIKREKNLQIDNCPRKFQIERITCRVCRNDEDHFDKFSFTPPCCLSLRTAW